MRTGFDSDGPGLGYPLVVLGLVSAVGALFAAGLLGSGEQARWKGGAVAAGFGLAAIVIPLS